MGAKEQLNLSADGYDHVVVLVHGTFARAASWTRPDSPLATTVAKALGGSVLLTSFEWSGRNSHAARLSGGTELAEYLRSLRLSYPTASLHIVAHSHGGNVVMYALRSTEIRDSLKSVVCLGTPFIVAYPRNVRSTLRLLKFAIITTGVLVALLFALAVGFVGTFFASEPSISKFITGALLTLVVGAPSFFAMRLLLRINRYVETKVATSLSAVQKLIVTSLQGQFDGVPVLNVQTRRDEAARYLRLVDRIAGIPFQVWSPIAVLWITVTVTVIYVSFMAFVAVQSDDWHNAWNEVMLALVFTYFLYLGIVVVVLASVTFIATVLCAIWPKIFRGHALGFGEDGFMKNWLVAISASSEPPNAGRSHDELLNVTGAGLHHSLLYQDERALHAVATWMGALVERREEPPNPGKF